MKTGAAFTYLPLSLMFTLGTATSYAQSFEEESLRLNAELEQLSSRLTAIEVLDSRDRLEPSQLTNHQVYAHSRSLFESGDFASAIPELVAFVTHAQLPDPTQHLQAQKMLAVSYEKTGNIIASVRASLRYLETQTTVPLADLDSFNEVTDLLLKNIKRNPAVLTDHDRKRLISALTGLKLPKEAYAQLLFHASDCLSDLGPIAMDWLKTAYKLSTDTHLQARILYKQSDWYDQNHEWDKSEAALNKIVKNEIKMDAGDDIIDLATMTLARLYIRQSNPAAALKLYQSLRTNSTWVPQRDYEQIFALRMLNDNKAAFDAAQKFIADYPKRPESLSIKEFIGLLAIDSKNFEIARTVLEQTVEELSSLRAEMLRIAKSKGELDFSQLAGLEQKISASTRVPEVVVTLNQTAASQELVTDHLHKIDFRLRSELYTLSQIGVDALQPQLRRRIEATKSVIQQFLLMGHTIVAQAVEAFKSNLTPDLIAQLKLSESQRLALYSKFEEWKAQRAAWIPEANLTMMSLDLRKQTELVAELRTKLSSSFLNSRTPTDLKRNQELVRSLDQHARQISEHASNLEIYAIKNPIETTAFKIWKSTQRRYSDHLHEEFEVLDAALSSVQDPRWRYLKKSFRQSWNSWRSLDVDLNNKVVELEQATNKNLLDLAGHYESSRASLQRLNQQSLANELRLYQIKTKLYDTITADSLSAIDFKLSKYRKWLADAHWTSVASLSETKAILNALESEKRSQIFAVGYETND